MRAGYVLSVLALAASLGTPAHAEPGSALLGASPAAPSPEGAAPKGPRLKRKGVDASAVTGSVAPHEAEAASLGLRGAIEHALANDPNIGAASANVTVADRQVWRELMRYAPTLSASISANQFKPADPLRNRAGSETSASIEASWTVFNGGARRYGVEAARSRRDAAALEAMSERGRTTMRMIEAWTDAISSSAELGIVEASIGRLGRLRSAVSDRRAAGFASTADVARVEADIASQRQRALAIKAELDKAQSAARRLAGRVPGAKARLPELAARIGADKDGLRASAHRNNPMIRAAAANRQSERYAARASMGNFLPTVDVTARYNVGIGSGSVPGSDPDGLSVGARLRIPLVDLTSVADYSVQSARADAAIKREAVVLQDVEAEIDGLWADLQASSGTRREAIREIDRRRRSAQAARQQLEKGFGSLEAAVDAEAALANAERAALQARLTETQAAAQLLIVTGRFDPSMID